MSINLLTKLHIATLSLNHGEYPDRQQGRKARQIINEVRNAACDAYAAKKEAAHQHALVYYPKMINLKIDYRYYDYYSSR